MDDLITFGLIALACLILAILEWFAPKPPEWVVKVKIWRNRK